MTVSETSLLPWLLYTIRVLFFPVAAAAPVWVNPLSGLHIQAIEEAPGGAVWAGKATDTAAVGGTAYPKGSAVVGFVSNTGEMVWSTGLTAAFVSVADLTSRDDGSSWLGGRFTGTLEVGGQSATCPTSRQCGYLVQFGPDGAVNQLLDTNMSVTSLSSRGDALAVGLVGHGELRVGGDSVAPPAVDAGVHGWVALLSGSGTLQHAQAIQGLLLSDVALDTDGSASFVGWFGRAPTSYGDQSWSARGEASSLLGRFNPDGSLGWAEVVGGWTHWNEFGGSVETHDGVTTAAIQYAGTALQSGVPLPWGSFHTLLLQVDSSGQTEHVQNLYAAERTLNKNHRFNHFRLERHPSGGHWLAGFLCKEVELGGETRSHDGFGDGYAIGFDLSTSSLGWLQVSSPTFDEVYDIAGSADGMVFLVGTTGEDSPWLSEGGAFIARTVAPALDHPLPTQTPAPHTIIPELMVPVRDAVQIRSKPEAGQVLVLSSWGHGGVGHALVAIADTTTSTPQLSSAWGAWTVDGSDQLVELWPPGQQSVPPDWRVHFGTIPDGHLSRILELGGEVILTLEEEDLTSIKTTLLNADLPDEVTADDATAMAEAQGLMSFAVEGALGARGIPAMSTPWLSELIDGLGRDEQAHPVPNALGQIHSLTDYANAHPGDNLILPGSAAIQLVPPEGDEELAWHELDEKFQPSGSRFGYDGELKEGLPHGKGVIRTGDRDVAQGDFRWGRLITGQQLGWHESGEPSFLRTLKDGERSGPQVYYDRFGRRVRHETYSGGRRDGVTVRFHPFTDVPAEISIYEKGSRIATKELFYDGIVHLGPDSGYIDLRPAGSVSESSQELTLSEFLEHDPYGRGQLSYTVLTRGGETKREHHMRRFPLPEGDLLTRLGGYAVYQWANGDQLRGAFGKTGQIEQSTVVDLDGFTTTVRPVEDFHGACELVRPDGAILIGECVNGFIEGNARYRHSDGSVHDVIVQNQTWTYTIQGPPIQVKEAGWLRRFGREVARTAERVEKEIFRAGNRAGEKFSEAMCSLVEPFVDKCNISAGVSCDSNGECTATDGQGNPSVKTAPKLPAEPIPLPQKRFNEEPFEGGWSRFGLTGEISGLGRPWPGMQWGQSVFPANGTGLIRGIDDFGSGAFGMSRSSSVGIHMGVDYKTTPMQEVLAPVSGTVRIITRVYGLKDKHGRPINNHGLTGIAISSGDFEAKVLYVAPTFGLKDGDRITVGNPIGYAQTLQEKYPGITDHVHVQLMDMRGVPKNSSGRYKGRGLPIPPDGSLPLLLPPDLLK